MYGTSSIKELGFEKPFRGQNLQISCIGKSIYSNEKSKSFYRLILPKYLTKYGTVNKVEYIGNRNKLKTLKKGDIIFGAEGNGKGRSLVIIKNNENIITNIHGIILKQKEHNISKAIFVKLFLDYLRHKKMIDAYAVGGNGGSLAIKYWDLIKFPNFPLEIENKITSLYYNNLDKYNINNCNIESFKKYDNNYNKVAGIYELDQSKNYLQELLDNTIKKIADDIEVKINFLVE